MAVPTNNSPTAADYFGGMVDSYDSLIRRAVPRYEEMTERLIEHLPRAPTHILELGCGTGNLTLQLAARCPNAAITTVDASPEMTRITTLRAQRQGAASRIQTITTAFEDLSLPPASFDVVTSCLSLHHVRDKAPLYRNIHKWLAPGGVLRFADQLRGVTDEAQQVYWNGWLRFCRLPGNCSEAEIESLSQHAANHDHYVPFPEHIRLMESAGFSNIDCVWRNLMYSVVAADR